MGLKQIFDSRHCNQPPIARPFIIAEAGVNHEASLDLAKLLIDEAKEGGADAIKFQTYKAESIASKFSPAYWDLTQEPTENQYELFKKYDMFWKKDFEELKIHCDKSDIEFLSTPFDTESACFLNDLMDVFKISSSDITNKPFIQYICEFEKPIILSTGASNLDEIKQALSWIDAKVNPLALLHCILNYPTADSDANLGMILDLKEKFPEHLIGYSDHTLPNDMKTLEIAAILGARIIEKHFTYDKSLPGNDHYHAMDKEDLKLLNKNLGRIYELLGDNRKHALSIEEPARQHARRSLVASKTIKVGTILSIEHLDFKRPGSGISPRDIDTVLGKRVTREIDKDQALHWEFLEDNN
jgi:sialic acid synthase SpsE